MDKTKNSGVLLEPAAAGSAPLLVALDRRTRIPLQRQIYASIRQAILAGRLVPGTRLPPSRALADDLGVSRTTVVLVYEHLETEGYIASRGSAGSFVRRTRHRTPRNSNNNPPFVSRASDSSRATHSLAGAVGTRAGERARIRHALSNRRAGDRPLPCSSLGAPRRSPNATVANQSVRIR